MPGRIDTHPSLSISVGKDGKVLFRDTAGKSTQEQVIAALKECGLWPLAPSRNGRKPKARETRYEVRDTGGKLIAVHIRTDKPNGAKDMYWTRPDGSLGLDGLPVSALPLYGSERLVGLPDGTRVVISEGEKAAVSLMARGVAAVATVTGATSTPGDDALRPLTRLSVVLWPDADAVGREHMVRVGGALLRLGCADVRIVHWPDAPDKGDAADVMGTDAELAELLDRAEPFETMPTPDGAEMLQDVRAFVRRYVATGDAEADTAALWTAHTWALEAFDCTPYLEITSPEKRSGKSRLLEVLEFVVAWPWFTGRTSPAALYRKIDADRPTLLLDESDAAFGGDKDYSQALRGILNSGWGRGGKTTVCVGQGANITTRDFSTFGAKAIAGIGNLPDTVADRAIRFVMRRRSPTEVVEPFRLREAEAAASPIRETLERWTAAHLDTLRNARPDIPNVDDRAAEGWEALLAIADAAGGDWPERARRAALVLSAGEGREDDSLGVRLLRDVRALFDKRGAERLPSVEIVAELVSDEGAPWGDLRGKPMDTRALARMLKPHGLKTRSVRLEDGSTPKGYHRCDFADAWSRYTPPESPPQAPQAPQDADTDTGAVADVADVAANPGVCEQETCTICGSLDSNGHTLTDGPLVRAAVGMGFPIVSRRQWDAVTEWRLCCDDQAELEFGSNYHRAATFHGDITATGDGSANPTNGPRDANGDA